MAEHKFQWSLFPDPARQEQYVVRCDDFADFLEGIELVKSILENSAQAQVVAPEPEPEIPVDQCPIHNKSMRLRTGKNGNTWYDHRWSIKNPDGNGADIWYVCNGKQEKVQAANGRA